MADYLHGVETQSRGNAPKNVSEVKTSVIGIVGKAASTGWEEEPPVNTPIVILKSDDVEKKLGSSDEEGTLPYYLKKAYEQFDKEVPVIIAVSVGTNAADATDGETDEESGVVYLVDHEGNIIVDGDGNPIVVESGASASSATEETETESTGSNPVEIDVEAVAGNVLRYTGVWALMKSQVRTRYVPRILIAPGYSHNRAVADALTSVANKLRARAFVDGDMDSVEAAILARGDAASSFGIHEKRTNLCFPRLVNGDKVYPMSLIAAAVRAKTDMDSKKGYHWSISSKKISGFTGLDVDVIYSINDKTAQSQYLNAAGILTVKNVDELQFCGNCNSSFDLNSSIGNTDHERFEVTSTTGDVIEDSIEYYTEQRIDQPINDVWIDDIVSDVSAFLRKLKERGAIAGGRAWYEPDANDPTELMAGHVVFDYDDAATPPADRITYRRSYNVSYLATLGR